MQIAEQPFTVFDVETTGLDPRSGHRIVEIGAVRIEDGVMDRSRTFQSLVNPERTVPEEAVRIHGITGRDLQSFPTSMEVLPAFFQFASSSILVAHNAPFDLSFLEVEKESCWGYVELPECFCTLQLSRHLFPEEGRHHLDAVAARLGAFGMQGRHRALSDACLTSKVFLKLLTVGNITTVDALRKAASPLVICP